jgi:hypothetical protein
MSSILEIWRSGDTYLLAEVLGEEAVFSSPANDYRGRADAAHMLTLIPQVLESFDSTEMWVSAGDSVTSFTASHAGRALEGMLRETRDEAGILVHVTLFLRPYRTLALAMDQMRDLMADSPLPSRVA